MRSCPAIGVEHRNRQTEGSKHLAARPCDEIPLGDRVKCLPVLPPDVIAQILRPWGPWRRPPEPIVGVERFQFAGEVGPGVLERAEPLV